MKIKVLVTGSNGQLGSEIRKLSSQLSEFEFHFTDVNELDITNEKSVDSYLDNLNPDYLINCAAYTAVDKAEQEPELSFMINGLAPGILAEKCRESDIKLIHVSTDYVFDGESSVPYNEKDPVNPQSSYGRSKLEGEKRVLENGVGMIIRTSWLYSGYGHNFVKTIINNARIKKELKVVNDQTGNPTWAFDLAKAILKIISLGKDKFIPGIYHYSNSGTCTWFDFAQEIIRLTKISCEITPISSSEYPFPTKRPKFSMLDTAKISQLYHVELPEWHTSLKECINQITVDMNIK